MKKKKKGLLGSLSKKKKGGSYWKKKITWLLNDTSHCQLAHLDRLAWTSEGCSPSPEGNKTGRWYRVARTSRLNRRSPGPLCFGSHAVRKSLTAYSCGSRVEMRLTDIPVQGLSNEHSVNISSSSGGRKVVRSFRNRRNMSGASRRHSAATFPKQLK